MSYNVLSHSHWGPGQFFGGRGGGGGGGVKKRQSPDFRSPEVGISGIGYIHSNKLCFGEIQRNIMAVPRHEGRPEIAFST